MTYDLYTATWNPVGEQYGLCKSTTQQGARRRIKLVLRVFWLEELGAQGLCWDCRHHLVYINMISEHNSRVSVV